MQMTERETYLRELRLCQKERNQAMESLNRWKVIAWCLLALWTVTAGALIVSGERSSPKDAPRQSQPFAQRP